ncbi:MAG: hypothetical protein E7204_03545 [Veillonella sp.]|uniref:YjiG family protein n=1 Tax=Veillonella sp. TaxID=1926307 RepID=UPI0025CD0497|nr:YjiG family protein [Veillonella sp.]MBE6079907.1 hypothetical protein [Veillonella sp.]
MATNETPVKKNLLDLFIEGARNGFKIGTMSLLPNVLMAFVLIRILDVTGLLKIIGEIFTPIMALWGLPGEAATVLVTAFMSMGGGIGVLVSLYTSNIIDPIQLSSLVPAIYLVGNPIQNIGRCLGIAGVDSRHYIPIVVICYINAFLSIWATRLLIAFL